LVVGAKPELTKIDDYCIRVNHPYRFGSYELYQSSYDDSQMKAMTFRLEDADGNTVGENFTVNLDEPDQSYQIDENTEIKMRAYAPDFQEIADNGTLVSETPVPRNP